MNKDFYLLEILVENHMLNTHIYFLTNSFDHLIENVLKVINLYVFLAGGYKKINLILSLGKVTKTINLLDYINIKIYPEYINTHSYNVKNNKPLSVVLETECHIRGYKPGDCDLVNMGKKGLKTIYKYYPTSINLLIDLLFGNYIVYVDIDVARIKKLVPRNLKRPISVTDIIKWNKRTLGYGSNIVLWDTRVEGEYYFADLYATIFYNPYKCENVMGNNLYSNNNFKDIMIITKCNKKIYPIEEELESDYETLIDLFR